MSFDACLKIAWVLVLLSLAVMIGVLLADKVAAIVAALLGAAGVTACVGGLVKGRSGSAGENR